MPLTFDDIRAAAMQLTEEERGELADSLLGSLDADGPQLSLDGLTDEEIHAELERRAQDAREHPELLLTWEQVRDMR